MPANDGAKNHERLLNSLWKKRGNGEEDTQDHRERPNKERRLKDAESTAKNSKCKCGSHRN